MTTVRLVGGPFDGESAEIEGSNEPGAVIYWPPDRAPVAADDDVPGVDDVTEYIAKGDGTAHYVGGLVDDEPTD